MNRQCLQKKTSDSKKFRIEKKAPKLGPLAVFGKILLSVSYDQHFCEFFLDDENICFVDYADDTTSYMLVTKQQKYK